MNKEDLEKNRKIFDEFDVFESISPTECTGLITIPAKSYEEWAEYNEIVRFAPPIK